MSHIILMLRLIKTVTTSVEQIFNPV